MIKWSYLMQKIFIWFKSHFPNEWFCTDFSLKSFMLYTRTIRSPKLIEVNKIHSGWEYVQKLPKISLSARTGNAGTWIWPSWWQSTEPKNDCQQKESGNVREQPGRQSQHHPTLQQEPASCGGWVVARQVSSTPDSAQWLQAHQTVCW